MEDDNNTASKLIEIKEILDFKENADYKKLSCDEIAILRDYITNLQQENENNIKMLYNIIKEQDGKLNDLQQENERLIKELENISLDEASIRADVLLEQQDYKSRCEKAIPMLKELNIKMKSILNIGIDIKEISDIEDTLNGRSEE